MHHADDSHAGARGRDVAGVRGGAAAVARGSPRAGGGGGVRGRVGRRLGVWASKYNDRAVLSCRKVGLSHENVSMAVLCQPVVQSQYAFVLHTTSRNWHP